MITAAKPNFLSIFHFLNYLYKIRDLVLCHNFGVATCRGHPAIRRQQIINLFELLKKIKTIEKLLRQINRSIQNISGCLLIKASRRGGGSNGERMAL